MRRSMAPAGPRQGALHRGGEHVKRLRNSTSIPDEVVRRVVDWIAADLGIAGFDVELRNSEYSFYSVDCLTAGGVRILSSSRTAPHLAVRREEADHKTRLRPRLTGPIL